MVTCYLHFLRLKILLAIASTMLSLSVSAAPLEWSISNPLGFAHPGDTVYFSGVITNGTGKTLESTDFFLDFLAFNPDNLVPNQELGIVPFTLPDLTNSGNVTLFNVDIDLHAATDTYHILVLLQDINGNLTDVADVSIIVSEVPEPSTTVLLLAGTFMLFVALQRQRLT